jgi:hypothetical protein
MPDRLSGKQSYFTYNGYQIPIDKLEMKGERQNVDSTDSGDYDLQTDQVYPTQIPVTSRVTATISGKFRKTSVGPVFWYSIFTNLTAVPCQFGADLGTLYGHGTFDINSFQITSPLTDVVTYSAEIISNGKFFPNQ